MTIANFLEEADPVGALVSMFEVAVDVVYLK